MQASYASAKGGSDRHQRDHDALPFVEGGGALKAEESN